MVPTTTPPPRPPRSLKEGEVGSRPRVGVYFTAMANVVVFAALTMLSLGYSRRTTVMTAFALSVLGVVALGVCVLLGEKLVFNNNPFGGLMRMFFGGSFLRTGKETTLSDPHHHEESTSSPDEDHLDWMDAIDAKGDRPRWERRWAKTEAKRQKKKESRTRVKQSCRLDSMDLEARERAKRLELAAEHRVKAEEMKKMKELQKHDRKLAAEAAERARQDLERCRRAKIDEEKRHGREKRAEKRRLDLEKKLEDARVERRNTASKLRFQLDALVAAAVALDALATFAEDALKGALAAVADAPQKRRSHKSKALAKKTRDRANDKKRLAASAQQKADDASRSAQEAFDKASTFFLESDDVLAFTLPSSIVNRLARGPPAADHGDDSDDDDGSFNDGSSLDRRSVASRASSKKCRVADDTDDDISNDGSGETAEAPVYIETPAEIKRLIEQVRTTVSVKNNWKKQCHIIHDDQRDPNLRCQ